MPDSMNHFMMEIASGKMSLPKIGKLPDIRAPTRPESFSKQTDPALLQRRLRDYSFHCVDKDDGKKKFRHTIAAFDKSEAEFIHTFRFPNHEVERIDAI
jgi:hypothetical protein